MSASWAKVLNKEAIDKREGLARPHGRFNTGESP
jgi:hypothetical protein